ncbi:MAG: 16S rRNA processing protein RimM [Candidatus Dadabacteria bacterium]
MGLIPFGRISKAHGLLGELRVHPFSRQLENLSRLERIFIQKCGEEKPQEFKVIRRRLEKESAIIGLEGIRSVDDAEKFRGCSVMVDTSDLVQTEEDEYYWFQLIGLMVYTTDGGYVGRVENLIDRAPQSLLVVKEDEKEFLIPMIDALVKEINLKDSRIVISPLSGLLD